MGGEEKWVLGKAEEISGDYKCERTWERGQVRRRGHGIIKLSLKNLISLTLHILQWRHGFVSAGVPTAASGTTEVPQKLAAMQGV